VDLIYAVDDPLVYSNKPWSKKLT